MNAQPYGNNRTEFVASEAIGALMNGQSVLLRDIRCCDKKSQMLEIAKRWLVDRGYKMNASDTGESGVDSKRIDVMAKSETLEKTCGIISQYVQQRITRSDALKDTTSVAALREQWRATCRSWTQVTDDTVVDYSSELPVFYACGTTPTNAMLMDTVFGCIPEALDRCIEARLKGTETSPLHAVLLCGGSCAELLALTLHCEEKVAQVKSHRKDSKWFLVEVDIVDLVAGWEPTVLSFASDLNAQCLHIDLRVRFHCADLLDPQWTLNGTALLQAANVVTLVYALSEMYERDSLAAGKVISFIAENVNESCSVLVVDPASLSKCGTKEQWLEQELSTKGLTLHDSSKIKIRVPASMLQSSPLHIWHTMLQLKLGHDIKVFANCWCHLYKKYLAVAQAEDLETNNDDRNKPSSSTSPSTTSKLILVTTPQAVDNWAKLLRSGSLNVFKATGTDGGDHARTLARCNRETESWHSLGGLLVFDFASLSIIYGNLKGKLGAVSARIFDIIKQVGLLCIDEIQLCLRSKQRIHGQNIKLVDALVYTNPKSVVAIANVSVSSVSDGHMLDRCENAENIEVIHDLLKRTYCTSTAGIQNIFEFKIGFEDFVALLAQHYVDVRGVKLEWEPTNFEKRLLSFQNFTVGGALREAISLHPKLVLDTKLSDKAWKKSFTPREAMNNRKSCPTELDYLSSSDVGLIEKKLKPFQGGRLSSLIQWLVTAVNKRSFHDVVLLCHKPLAIKLLVEWLSDGADDLAQNVPCIQWTELGDSSSLGKRTSGRHQTERAEKKRFIESEAMLQTQWQKVQNPVDVVASQDTLSGMRLLIASLDSLHNVGKNLPKTSDAIVVFDHDASGLSDALKQKREEHAISLLCPLERRKPVTVVRFCGPKEYS